MAAQRSVGRSGLTHSRVSESLASPAIENSNRMVAWLSKMEGLMQALHAA